MLVEGFYTYLIINNQVCFGKTLMFLQLLIVSLDLVILLQLRCWTLERGLVIVLLWSRSSLTLCVDMGIARVELSVALVAPESLAICHDTA